MGLYLLNDYVATLLALILGGLALVGLLFSLLFELVESSKVPRAYFSILVLSILAPLTAAILYATAMQGFPWMEE